MRSCMWADDLGPPPALLGPTPQPSCLVESDSWNAQLHIQYCPLHVALLCSRLGQSESWACGRVQRGTRISSLRLVAAAGVWGHEAVPQPQPSKHIGCITSRAGAAGPRRRAVPQHMATCICADQREEATGALPARCPRSLNSVAAVEPAYIPAAVHMPSRRLI